MGYTVKKLIEDLKKYPEDMEISCECDETCAPDPCEHQWGIASIDKIKEEEYYQINDDTILTDRDEFLERFSEQLIDADTDNIRPIRTDEEYEALAEKEADRIVKHVLALKISA